MKNITDQLSLEQEQLEKIDFGDESLFHQFREYHYYERRSTNKRFDLKYTVPSMKPPPNTMVWDCFSGADVGFVFSPKEDDFQ
jgi:hypothetical protein